MDEFALIHQFFNKQHADPDVIVGIGDDGAVLRPRSGRELVSVVDTSVAGIHFPVSMSPADIAYRAVAVNLSDLAAMAATPRWMLLSLTLPDSNSAWLREFANGLFEAASEHDVALVGGDTTRGDTLVISIHMLGDAEAEKIIMRSGAQQGDQIWVTGSTGDAAAGLRLLQDKAPQDGDAGYLQRRFCRPSARVDFACAIADVASAAIDISDGLFADLQKLVESSGVAAALDLEHAPMSAALKNEFPAEAQDYCLAGGDDYELCFTAAAERRPQVEAAAQQCGVPVTVFGEIAAGSGIVCRLNGEVVPFADPGYRHF